jgi:hypothetical protein
MHEPVAHIHACELRSTIGSLSQIVRSFGFGTLRGNPVASISSAGAAARILASLNDTNLRGCMEVRHGTESSESQDVRLLCGWCGCLLRESTDARATTSHGICATCARVLEGTTSREKSLRSNDLLVSIEEHVNQLMCGLYESRQRLLDIQRRVGDDGELLGRVGQAIAAIRRQERAVAEIQRCILSVQR